MSGAYNPAFAPDRAALGKALLAAFAAKGFRTVSSGGGRETVVGFPVKGMERVEVRVYTTVVGGSVRALGKDAIRVVATYETREGQERGLAHTARVFRTGTIDAIVERAVERAREVYRDVRTAERCRCGAPRFKARSGKVVCAEACWDRPAAPVPPPVPAPCIDGWEHYASKETSDETAPMRGKKEGVK